MKIKLSPEAVEKFGQLFREFKTAPTQELKTEMISLFAPHIECKAAAAAAKSGGKTSAVDYAQDLYLNFLEMLESAGKNEQNVCKRFTTMVEKAKPKETALFTRGHTAIEEMTPFEELDKLSCRFDKQTTLQKANEIVEASHLTQREIDVLKLSIDRYGYSTGEISDILELTDGRTKNIYERGVERIKNCSKEPAIQAIYCDDLHIDRMSTELTDINFEKIRKIKLEGLMTSIKYRLNKIIKKQLNGNLPGWWGTNFVPFGGAKSEIYVKEMLYENPDFTLKIRLPEQFKTPDFIKGAELLSVETYGKNILEFV